MYNRVILIGRLTREPEQRTTGSGITVANFTLAVDRRYGSSDDSKESQTDFIDIVPWRQLGDLVVQYVTKGRMVAVEGKLQVRKWQDSNGNNRTTYEVVADDVRFLESRRSQDSGDRPPASQEQSDTFAADKDYEDNNDVFGSSDFGDDDDPLAMS